MSCRITGLHQTNGHFLIACEGIVQKIYTEMRDVIFLIANRVICSRSVFSRPAGNSVNFCVPKKTSLCVGKEMIEECN